VLLKIYRHGNAGAEGPWILGLKGRTRVLAEILAPRKAEFWKAFPEDEPEFRAPKSW
jgi:hypothetical protein